jgi:ubiquinone/menaquinone biosynthesis C-methylase UbiE
MHDGLNKTFASSNYHKKEVWKRRARFYDPFLKLVFLPFGGENSFRKSCVDFASPAERDRVLDVCCGTGRLTSLIAQRIGSEGQVIGVDLSESVLEIARKRTRNMPVTFQRANVENLPFTSARFDKCFISFGLHEMPRQARHNTLREIHRTLRPGGRLFIVEYNLPTGTLARLAIKAFVKIIEDKAAYRMLLDSSLVTEVEEGGLAIKRREFVYSGIIQLIEATNP